MAPGAGFEPACVRINSTAASQLGYPGKTLVGNLGVEPSDSAIRTQRICRLPRSRKSNLAGPSGFEPESQPSEGWALSRWTMDRNELGWPEEIESSWTVPQTAAYPLGHGHTWCQETPGEF